MKGRREAFGRSSTRSLDKLRDPNRSALRTNSSPPLNCLEVPCTGNSTGNPDGRLSAMGGWGHPLKTRLQPAIEQRISRWRQAYLSNSHPILKRETPPDPARHLRSSPITLDPAARYLALLFRDLRQQRSERSILPRTIAAGSEVKTFPISYRATMLNTTSALSSAQVRGGPIPQKAPEPVLPCAPGNLYEKATRT